MCRSGNSPRLEKREKVEEWTKIGVVITIPPGGGGRERRFQVVWESYPLMMGFGGMLSELYL